MTIVGPTRNARAEIAGVAVKSATTHAFQGLTGGRPLMSETVDLRFGTISKPQFDALHAEFGGRSGVRFDATREYSAIDFLPPMLQALVNRDLDPGGPFKLKGTKRLNDQMGNQDRGDLEINSSPNCHGTSWEAMRAFQGENTALVQLMFGDPMMAGDTFIDEKLFETIGVAGKPETFLSELRPGDVVTFKQGEYALLHSATYVGGGLFFEKPNTESDTFEESPYRLVTFEQVVAPIHDFIGEPPSPTALRPRGPLEPGVQLFAAGTDEDVQRLKAWATKKGQPVTKPLVRELEVGFGGGIRGLHLNAVEQVRMSSTPDGRAIVTP